MGRQIFSKNVLFPLTFCFIFVSSCWNFCSVPSNAPNIRLFLAFAFSSTFCAANASCLLGTSFGVTITLTVPNERNTHHTIAKCTYLTNQPLRLLLDLLLKVMLLLLRDRRPFRQPPKHAAEPPLRRRRLSLVVFVAALLLRNAGRRPTMAHVDGRRAPLQRGTGELGGVAADQTLYALVHEPGMFEVY